MRARASAAVLVLLPALLLAGCSREAPDVRDVRKATEEYLKALAGRDLKGVAERSTCVVSANSLVGGRVLRIDPSRRVRTAALDSLVGASFAAQRTADSVWARADESTADSLFRHARLLSNRAAVYRSAMRAVPLSGAAVATPVGNDSTLETRAVRVRIRYAGPLVGPGPVDKEETVRLLRVPGGKWIAFSVYLIADDPEPEMI